MTDRLSREYEINYSHIDNRGAARPSFLWEVMQDTAAAHAQALHVSVDELPILWVLSRVRVRIFRPLHPFERLRCETWCPGARGVSWYRGFDFFAGEEPVGRAHSMWVMLDPVKRRPLRPSSMPVDPELLRVPDETLLKPLPTLFCENAAPHHTHQVRYSDLDINNHVNNVRVVELISDALDLQNRQTGFVSELQVNYIAETVCGAQLTLYRGTAEGAQYIRGETDGSTHFEALARLSPLPSTEGDAP